jgi:hypothetical protein
MVVVVLVAAAACLPAVLEHASGEPLLRAGLLAAGAALAVARLGDLVLRRVAVAPEASRGWAALVLALAVGTALAVPEAGDGLAQRQALLVGLAAAATAVVADVLVDLAASEAAVDERRRQSLLPVVTLLPFALLGPVLVVAARLVERS